MTTVIVDWLGRGGIAQTTAAWVDAIGDDVILAARPGRELPSVADDRSWLPGPLAAHASLARSAAAVILERQPQQVIIQNYVVPALERRVHHAARQVGARVVFVVHDHHLHSTLAGSHVGLGRLVRQADDVIAHSSFVAANIGARYQRPDVRVVPLPVPRDVPEPYVKGRTVVHYGILKRGYKGTDRVIRLAHRSPEWQFVVVGTGAAGDEVVGCVPGYVPMPELMTLVGSAGAAVFPYRFASQSGAVALAQVLGCVPIASAVGGIPEQIRDGVTGLLVPPDADDDEWLAALRALEDDTARQQMADAAVAARWADDAVFRAEVGSLCRV